MAEALAVVGIVANIIQLVDFGSKILHRLTEFQSSVEDVPESFRHIKAKLPLLLHTLQQTKEAIEAGSIRDDTKKALLPAIEGCWEQIKLLDLVLLKTLPTSGDSWTKRSRKAIWMSLRYDSKVEKITAIIRDYIQTLTYHHATASSTLVPLRGRSPLRPTRCSTVPFRRDQDFIDRGILTEIHQRCSQPASRTALVGLGGVGKSQLAIEYAYQVRAQSPDIWVFWVHASSLARFEEGYRRIADVVKLPGCDKPEADILQLIRNWLCDETNGHWVMMIDNADDPSVFFSQLDRTKSSECNGSAQASSCLVDFLPQSPNGSILITSRNRDVAHRLTGSSSNIIRVEPMDQSDALALLHKKLQGDLSTDDAVELLQALDYMPLAITQAAAYISQRAPRITISRYLDNLRRSDKDRATLLKKDVGDVRRDGSASNSIIATWQISFEHIRKESPAAARLLSLMSLFDRQGIPDSLLYNHYQEGDDIEAEFEEDMYTLASYSLVGTNVEGKEFEMHRLVLFSTKKWLELRDELERWKERYITIMEKAFPIGRHENWTTCQRLFPHAEAILTYRPVNDDYLAQWASILFNAAWYADDKGNYNAAEEMNRRALEGYKKARGVGNSDTLASMGNLALVLRNQGRYEEAEAMNRRALDGWEKVLGKEHPHTLTSVDNLATVLRYQGRYEEAEAMNRRALDGREKMLGKAHPNTLRSVNNLALVLQDQGRYEEAEAMNRRVLDGWEKVLGKEHPDTLTSVNNLALVLQDQGRYEEAEAMNRRALDGREKMLGKEHPHTLASVDNLASVLRYQGRYEEAEATNRRTLDGTLTSVASF